MDSFAKRVDEEIESARKKFPHQEELLDRFEWYTVLLEEVGEVARHLNEHGISNDVKNTVEEEGKLCKELIQVAAMAGRMYHNIIRYSDVREESMDG